MPQKKQQMRQLTREEFQDALKKGLGRAVQHVRNSPPEAVREDLAHACTQYLGMNLQDELGGRVPWLFRMIEVTGEFDFYRQKVIEAIEQMPDNPDDAETFNELFGLLAEFAARGDSEILEIMRRRFDSACVLYEPNFGFDDLYRLDGFDALLRLLRREWKRICDDEELVADDYEIRIAEEDLGKDAVQAALDEAARGDESVRLYLERMNRQQRALKAERAARKRIKKEKVAPPSLRELIDDQENDWPTEAEWTNESFRAAFLSRRNQFLHIGRSYAKPTPEELEYALQKLLETTDPGWQFCLLGIFVKETMPRLEPRLLSLLDSPLQTLQWGAEQAISRVADSAVREKGLELIAKGPEFQDWHLGIGLLEKNFQSGDELILLEKLESISPDVDIHDLHTVGMTILDLAAANPEAPLEPHLLWIYEKTYCPHCRCRSVEYMIQRHIAPQHLLEECLDDSYQYTRELIQNLTTSPQKVQP